MGIGLKLKTNEDDFSKKDELPSVGEWIKTQDIKSTKDIQIPERLVDQVIGQDDAVVVIKKAAEQKRHVMLIGDPGTGKSMLAKSMTEFLPKDEMQDVIAYHNPEDPNEPKVRVVPAGKGKEIVGAQKAEAMRRKEQKASMTMFLAFMIVGVALLLSINRDPDTGGITINPMVLILGIFAAVLLFMVLNYPGRRRDTLLVPKLLLSHTRDDSAPFIDATGAHAGALLGDVKHDPFQSGGLETPAHERVEVGAIHKANKGVLFIDEINILRLESQQSLLTALQEKEFPIIGQSERSSGAMVKSQPVPCDFILVAAGNLDAVQGMHPALRSRIRGYGYEIYMKNTMDDTLENRQKLVRFVAQEISKDKKIPHYNMDAVAEIIHEAQRRAGRRGQLSLRLRELGGLIRVAGDIAHEEHAEIVTQKHVIKAKQIARTLEQQVADRYIERRQDYRSFVVEGSEVGVVNGLAVMGGGEAGISEYSGIVLPIVAEVTPAHSRSGGSIIATGKLGDIAKEAVQNVSALVKKYTGEDISKYDVHIQFIGTHEGVEGDSASISVAAAVISALENVEVDQSVGMTGSLSVRGRVLPVGGVTAKIEAAAKAGIKKVLIPKANMRDVLIEDKYKEDVEVVPVETLKDVLSHALVGTEKDGLLNKLSSLVPKPKPDVHLPVDRPVDRATPQ
ncbi:MAG: ATP-dependent protease LonB [Thermoplasmata archaeon]|nr:MAG: ATP-dependent protease LonB [Thermoplasmata archaeon]